MYSAFFMQAFDDEPKKVAPLPIISIDELKKFSGKDPKKPVYVAVQGHVFDVSKDRERFTKGGALEAYAGREVARAIARGTVTDEDVGDSNIRDLPNSDVDRLEKQMKLYRGKYPRKFKIGQPVSPSDAQLTSSSTSNNNSATTKNGSTLTQRKKQKGGQQQQQADSKSDVKDASQAQILQSQQQQPSTGWSWQMKVALLYLIVGVLSALVMVYTYIVPPDELDESWTGKKVAAPVVDNERNLNQAYAALKEDVQQAGDVLDIVWTV